MPTPTRSPFAAGFRFAISSLILVDATCVSIRSTVARAIELGTRELVVAFAAATVSPRAKHLEERTSADTRIALFIEFREPLPQVAPCEGPAITA